MNIDINKYYTRMELQNALRIKSTALYERIATGLLPLPVKYLGRSWWAKSDKQIREAVRKASKNENI